MKVFLLISVFFLVPVLTHAQSKTFYHITIDFYKGLGRHGSLLAVTDSGLTYRVRKRPSVVVSYIEVRHLRITKETTSFGIPHVTAIAVLANVAYGLTAPKIVDRGDIILQRSSLIYLAGYLLQTVVHPSPLVINFKRYKPDQTSLKDMLEPFILNQ